jgi:hypothetical protein
MVTVIFASMIIRESFLEILNLMQETPAVTILGPRQVGKTTLAHQLAEKLQPNPLYLDLELPSDIAKLREPEAFFNLHADRLIILDEIQRIPEIFSILRGVIDQRKKTGRQTAQFLILGSASLDLLQQSSESLAGRISYVYLSGLIATEVQKTRKDSQEILWLRGGFPQSYLAKTDASSMLWRQDFIRTYLERDVPQFGIRVPAATLRNFWSMLAHLQGTTINMSRLASGMGVSVPTIGRYLDLLEDLFLIRKLQPWHNNLGKRLVKAPKVYIRDTGLMHALLSIENIDALMGHPSIGESWEGFVLENLLSQCPKWITPYYYRTATGVEIDLFLELNSKKRIAIEIKRTLSPTVTKGFQTACDDLQATHKFYVYPGQERFPIAKDVWAASLLDMMTLIREENSR